MTAIAKIVTLGFTFGTVLCATSAFAGAIAGTSSGRPTQYEVTVKKVELCRSSACSDPFVLGTVNGAFDIASVTVGEDIGKLVDITGIPLYQTWSHVRVTLSTAFTLSADDGTCATNGTNYTNRGAALAGLGNAVASGGGGAGTAQTMVLPNDAPIDAVLGAFDYADYGITQTDGDSEFKMTIALASPYVCKGEMPRIEVKFNTDQAFGYNAGCNFTFPQPPTITITASDP